MINSCHWCGGHLKTILPLGPMPLVNYFPTGKDIKKEKRYRLTFCVCTSCGLAQVKERIDPKKLFGRYHYVSGASEPLAQTLQAFATSIRAKNVLDIGSNDGTLLTAFQKQGSIVLGVEPARTIKSTVPTIRGFFTHRLAKKIVKTHGQFDLVTATHVLANVPNLADFLAGVREVLTPTGTFVVEVGSLEDLIKHAQFDSIYHEHYSYFSLETLSMILSASGFTIIRATHEKTQGGSIRVIAKKGTSFYTKKYAIDYKHFTTRVESFRSALKKAMQGKKVVAFGAPAKGVTLLNYCKLGPKDIAFVVDSTPQKQGRLVPGVHIPVYNEDRLKNARVDAILLLSWNYRDQIIEKIRRLTARGIKIIVPFPTLQVFR